jgi:hypothetical protein
MNNVESILSEEDLADLQWAHRHLENPSLAARISHVIGFPIENGLKVLPRSWYQRIHDAAELSILKTLKVAVSSMDHIAPHPAHNGIHKIMVMGSGALGGFFGPVALLAELPITTSLIMRTIADIAHSQGEDLSDINAQVACMEVFALGGRSKDDDASETGYYGLRTALALHFTPVMDYVNGGIGINIPAAIGLVRAISARFGVVISDKAAAQMIPVAGAVSGALLNLIFMQHFQDMARGHFIVRRLEREYGVEEIRVEYEKIGREADAEKNKDYSALDGW